MSLLESFYRSRSTGGADLRSAIRHEVIIDASRERGTVPERAAGSRYGTHGTNAAGERFIADRGFLP